MTEGAFGLPLDVDFVLTTAFVCFGIAGFAYFAAGAFTAATGLIGIGVGILLGAGYEGKKND